MQHSQPGGKPLCLLVALLLACFSGQAQDINTRTFKLTQIQFEGLKEITLEKAIETTGLQKGQSVQLPLLQQASQRLLTSGLFRQVNFKYRYRGDEIEATFVIEENRTSLPCFFDNFAWFTDEELYAAIRRDLPNFTGKATEGGEMVETIRRALEKLLRENKLTGRVEAEMTNGGNTHLFRVAETKLPVCEVNFAGVAAFDLKPLREEMKEIFGTEYSREASVIIARDRVVPLYHQKGYLKIRIKGAQATFNQATSGKCAQQVTVLFPLEEGLSYRWNAPNWSGLEVLTVDLLTPRFGLKPGDVADGLKIRKGLRDISDLYLSKGYFGLDLKPQPSFDEAARTVTYNIAMKEGPQYKIGALITQKLPDTLNQKLQQQWQAIAGKPYEATLVNSVLQRFINDPKAYELRMEPNHQTLVVQLTIEPR
ncbi:MAG: POTRA domain-containing protein [Blastocatellia bacterium]